MAEPVTLCLRAIRSNLDLQALRGEVNGLVTESFLDSVSEQVEYPLAFFFGGQRFSLTVGVCTD